MDTKDAEYQEKLKRVQANAQSALDVVIAMTPDAPFEVILGLLASTVEKQGENGLIRVLGMLAAAIDRHHKERAAQKDA